MDQIELFTRYFLATYFLMIGIYYACRSYAMSERHGMTFINYGKTFSRTWFYRQLFNLFRAAILLVCMGRAINPDLDHALGIFETLYHPLVLVLGILCLLLSYGVIAYVAGYMDQDWRSGIKEDQKKQSLVTTGPFSRSRNPQFIGILLGQLGFFLALPSCFSGVCLLVGMLVVWGQSLAEEKALEKQFGDNYLLYKQAVPRWL